MIKNSLNDVINDCKARHDAVSSAHQQLKGENDDWNKLIITISLITGMIESIKMKLKLDAPVWSLIPILLSSVIAGCSSLMKFRDYPKRMEMLIQSQSLLTNTITKLRSHTELDADLLNEYNLALSSLENTMYPNQRKVFLKQSHKNLIEIMKQEQKYYDLINKVNTGEIVDSDSNNSKEEVVVNVMDYSNHRQKPLDNIDEEL